MSSVFVPQGSNSWLFFTVKRQPQPHKARVMSVSQCFYFLPQKPRLIQTLFMKDAKFRQKRSKLFHLHFNSLTSCRPHRLLVIFFWKCMKKYFFPLFGMVKLITLRGGLGLKCLATLDIALKAAWIQWLYNNKEWFTSRLFVAQCAPSFINLYPFLQLCPVPNKDVNIFFS